MVTLDLLEIPEPSSLPKECRGSLTEAFEENEGYFRSMSHLTVVTFTLESSQIFFKSFIFEAILIEKYEARQTRESSAFSTSETTIHFKRL